MAKKIIKEMIIMLLLVLAIILILGVLLYEYVPNNKMIPDKVSYTTPEEVQEELSKSKGVENDEIILTYSVDSTDLDNYERINTYVPGKVNPFSPYNGTTSSEENATQTGNSTVTGDNTNSEGLTGTNHTTSSGNSVYYPDTGSI